MSKEFIPYFAISQGFHLVYRNSATASPIGPHTHNGAELYLTLTPLPDVLLRDTVQQVPAGTLIIIPPYCVHQLFHVANLTYERYILSIDVDWLMQVFGENNALFPYLTWDSDPLLLPLSAGQLSVLTTALQEFLPKAKTPSFDAMSAFFQALGIIDRLIAELAPTLFGQTANISAAQRNVNQMISYIHAHLTDNLTVADLATHFYLNPDYVSRLFKQHTHTAVKHYILLQKITKAQMLLHLGWSVTAVAEHLGFSSYAHFFKTFRRLTGTTPGQYRERDTE